MRDNLNRQNNTTPFTAGTQGQEVIEQFLQQLRPNGPWMLLAILPDDPPSQSIPKIIAKTFNTIAEALAFVGQHNGTHNLYYSTNPTKQPMDKKAGKIHIARIEYCLADCDPAKNENSEDAKARYLGLLSGSFEPRPTAIVNSGNGIQCLWRLDQPIDLSQYPLAKGKDGKLTLGPEAQQIVDDVEARTKEIMIRLGAEPGTQNIDRILRLPGTINLPNKKKRENGRVECPTGVISFNDASYALESFPLPVPEEPKPKTPEGGDPPRKEPEAHEGKLERIIRLGENGEFGGDRSNAVLYVACEMLRRRCPEPTIVSTLLDPANRIADHVRAQSNPRAYALRQVARARQRVPLPDVVVLPPSQWMGEKPAAAPPALIKGVFPQTGVAIIGGQSGGGKTFHAINIGAHLIPDCEQNFYIDEYRIKRQGGVLYLVLEGKPAFHLRVTTAFETMLKMQMEFGDRAKLPFCWNTYEPDLFHKGPDALIKLAEREAQQMHREFNVDLVAVFLDTMGLAACYDNEDKAAEVQKVISGLSKLSDATGALAIGVDHFGKDQTAGLRGSSAKRGHAETVLACLVDRDKDGRPSNHRLLFEKIRDGEEGRIIPYRLRVVDLGRDEDGDPLSTCVIQWEFDRKQPTRKGATKQKTDVCLDKAIEEVGGLPAKHDTLKEAFYKAHGGTNKAANTAWHRALKDIGLVFHEGWLNYGM